MKKLIISTALAVMMGLNMNAQVVISNDFGKPVGNADDLNSDVNWSWNDDYHRPGIGNIYEDDYDYNNSFFYAGLSWYNNKSVNVFGLNAGYLRWNGFGGDFNWAADVEFKALQDINLSGNYSLGLWRTGSSMGMLTVALGPSYRIYKTDGDKTEGKVDIVADPRLLIRANKILVTLGTQLRFKELHFTKAYTDKPVFHFGLAYCF